MCAMAREYDMPLLMRDAESWLVRAVNEGKLLAVPDSPFGSTAPLTRKVSAEFVRMLALAREFKLRDFVAVFRTVIVKLDLAQARQLLDRELCYALN